MNKLEIIKCKLLLDKGVVFLSTLMVQLPVSFSDKCSTACTDGKSILINEQFWDRLNDSEKCFILLHETFHVALLHFERVKQYDPMKYNMAGDYVINSWIKKQGYEMPVGGLYEPDYDGLSTEEIYHILPDDAEMPDDLQDLISGLSQEDIQEVQAKIQSSAIMAKMKGAIGNIPEEVQRHLDNLLKPKVQWNIVLRRFMTDLSKGDYSWRKPRKKLLSHGLYMPSLSNPSLAKITVAIDTSGSISEEQFQQFISEVDYIIKKFKPKELELIQWDTCIKSIDTITSASDLRSIEFYGLGGTDVSEVLNHFNTSNSVALVCITDGEFYYPNVKVKKPILWCVHSNDSFKPNQGKVIYF